MRKPPSHNNRYPNPLHPPHHGWFENEEKTRPLKDIGERLVKIGNLLVKNGKFTLGKSRITPPKKCEFIIRYERMPDGKLSLKLELKWEETDQRYSPVSGDADLRIEE
ncbi:MAG: amphi-Trp domain-containing protein [Candidatus Hodarchaeales archaeon]